MSREISLSQGKVAIVDDEDYKDLMQHKWCAHNVGRTWYAVRNDKPDKDGKKELIRMHRQILGLIKGDGSNVDHISGNALDNRRINLRLCAHGQNMFNHAPRAGVTSKYKGVHKNNRNGKWIAQVSAKGKTYHLGTFDNDLDAARAYDVAAVEHQGEFARLNCDSFGFKEK